MIRIEGREIALGSFPDGTLLLKEAVEGDYASKLEKTIEWYYESDRELVALIFLTKHLRSHGVEYLHLFLPYIPNARQDRVKKDEDVFTLKYFSQVINDLDFCSVTVLDPHSYVSEALIDRIRILSPKPYVDRVIAELTKKEVPLLMFYPDEGSMKRYSGMVDRPYAFGMKKRDWATGEIQGLEVLGRTKLIKDHNILIVDDICSRGGTFFYSAKQLKELGAKDVYLYVSHCEPAIWEGELLSSGLVSKVFTTNSIFVETSRMRQSSGIPGAKECGTDLEKPCTVKRREGYEKIEVFDLNICQGLRGNH